MERKLKVFIGSLICAIALTASALGVAPVPGTYDPETLIFYESGVKVPIFEEIPSQVNHKLTRSTMNVITILQNSPDQAWTYPTSDFDDMLFSDHTYPTGSMRDYYEEVSYGQLSLQGQVYGWYTSQYNYDYYVAGSYGLPPDGKASEFVTEAILNADPDVDFSQYDNDGDGIVEGVIIIHQGAGGEGGDPNTFWSHKGWLSPSVTVDGVTVQEYTLNPEKKNHGPIETIGVFAHEFGHTLGAPDLYDTSYGGGNPVDRWCIMGSGSYNGQPSGSNPAHFMAWIKSFYGWITPTALSEPQNGLVLNDIKMISDAQSAYKLPINGSADEYFLVENRWSGSPAYFDQRGSGYDSGILLQLCHDRGKTTGIPWYCTLIDANPSIPSKKDAAFAAEDNQKDCTPFTAIKTDGSYLPSGISLLNASNSGATMSFDLDLKPVFIYNQMQLTKNEAGVYSLSVKLQNLAYHATSVSAILSCSSSQVTITKNTASFPNINSGAIGSNVSDPFTYTVNSSGPHGEIADFSLLITANGIELSYLPVYFKVIVNPSAILFVDDDQDQRFRPLDLDQYYKEALDQTGFTYDVWENAIYQTHPEIANLGQYDMVFWNTSPAYNLALTTAEEDTIAEYLEGGGNLFLSSQEYLYQYYKYPGDDDYIAQTEAGQFPHDYLHIAQVEQDEYYYRVTGVQGSPLTAGMDAQLTDLISTDPIGSDPESGGYNWWPDNIVPLSDAETILTGEPHNYPAGMHADYQDSTADVITPGPAALMYPKPGATADYKVVFLAFSFEGLPLADRVSLLTNAINWFDDTQVSDGIDLMINQTDFVANDTFLLSTTLTNSGATVSLDEYIILDVWGQAYYFYPTWTENFEFSTITLNPGSQNQTILTFAWPEGAGEASGIMFWGALFNAGTCDVSTLFGEIDSVTFGWH